MAGQIQELRRAARALENAVPSEARDAAMKAVVCAEAHFSNLIELHYVAPQDVAMLLDDPRAGGDGPMLQEAAAHLEAQRTVDGLCREQLRPTSQVFLKAAHAAFGGSLHPEMLLLDGDCKVLRPGCYREGSGEEIVVGAHHGPSPDQVAAFMEAYEAGYADIYGSPDAILTAAPAAHHRFLFVHPFQDLNGRTSRFLLQGLIRAAQVDAGGLWSPSRMCALMFGGRDEYCAALAFADRLKRYEADGDGHLSEEALDVFCKGFIAAMAAEIEEMTQLLASGRRFEDLIADERLFPPPLPEEEMAAALGS